MLNTRPAVSPPAALIVRPDIPVTVSVPPEPLRLSSAPAWLPALASVRFCRLTVRTSAPERMSTAAPPPETVLLRIVAMPAVPLAKMPAPVPVFETTTPSITLVPPSCTVPMASAEVSSGAPEPALGLLITPVVMPKTITLAGAPPVTLKVSTSRKLSSVWLLASVSVPVIVSKLPAPA